FRPDVPGRLLGQRTLAGSWHGNLATGTIQNAAAAFSRGIGRDAVVGRITVPAGLTHDRTGRRTTGGDDILHAPICVFADFASPGIDIAGLQIPGPFHRRIAGDISEIVIGDR